MSQYISGILRTDFLEYSGLLKTGQALEHSLKALLLLPGKKPPNS
jgi:hypothetical protein